MYEIGAKIAARLLQIYSASEEQNMHADQREPNPDVNTFGTREGGGEDPNEPERGNEQWSDEEGIPVPPDVEPTHPIEEPPDTEDVPMGDVDDSPKKIVGE